MHFTLSTKIPATPETIYQCWLQSEGHAAMTGVNAVISDKEGGTFSVYSGYITGMNVELAPNKKIVQQWRTTEFKDTDKDSLIEITLVSLGNETLLTLVHNNIPDGSPDYAQGWEDYYFVPMRVYFSGISHS